MHHPRVAREVSRHILRTVRRQNPILVRNALLRDGEKEPLSSRHPEEFKWYSCGPTVYDDAHLGHARAYVCLDVIRRILTSLTGVHVGYAMGITDIDDKILQRSKEYGVSPSAHAAQFERRFLQDMDSLNVMLPTSILRVSEHIPEVQQFISDLISSGSAYSSERGNVYFSVQSSGNRYRQLDPSRGQPSENDDAHVDGTEHSEKRDLRDFALWKRADELNLNEGTWDSPWGRGRPGWHIECSAMVMSSLGNYLDMHTGGIDLRFPHHTNELATAEAKLCCSPDISGQTEYLERWSHTWLHVGHLHIAGRKMSKSLKNFVSVRNFLEQGGNADAFRTFCLLHKYSSGIEYSEDRLADAQSFTGKLRRFLARQPDAAQITACNPSYRDRPSMHPRCAHAKNLEKETASIRNDIEDALADDFNTPRAMSKISQLVSKANSSMTGDDRWVSGPAALAYKSACGVVKDTMGMLGISASTLQPKAQDFGDKHSAQASREAIDALVLFRAKVREAAKKKDMGAIFQVCDRVRDSALSDLGVRILDKKDGSSSWNRN